MGRRLSLLQAQRATVRPAAAVPGEQSREEIMLCWGTGPAHATEAWSPPMPRHAPPAEDCHQSAQPEHGRVHLTGPVPGAQCSWKPLQEGLEQAAGEGGGTGGTTHPHMRLRIGMLCQSAGLIISLVNHVKPCGVLHMPKPQLRYAPSEGRAQKCWMPGQAPASQHRIMAVDPTSRQARGKADSEHAGVRS